MKKNRIGLLAVVGFLSALVSGCSSVRARSELLGAYWDVYPGVQQDAKEITDAFGGDLPGPEWTYAIVVPMLLVDMPFSAVLDTVALPYDLYRLYNPEAFAGKR